MDSQIIVHLQNLVRELQTKVDLLEAENSHLKQQLNEKVNN